MKRGNVITGDMEVAMAIPAAGAGPTRLPVRTHARVWRDFRRSLLSPGMPHAVAVVVQYAVAIGCLAVLTWVVMLLAYAPFAHLH